MKLIYMGTPDFAARILSALIDFKYNISLVVTQPDKPRGRSGRLMPSEVKKTACKAGIKVIQPEKLSAYETINEIAAKKPDAIVVAAYGKIIPKAILEIPKYGCINVHASLLPKYRGAAPIQWAILDGESKTGVTIMRMNEGLDTGDIVSQKEVLIEKKETSDSLFEKLSDIGCGLLAETLNKIEKGSIDFTSQQKESPTRYARMITKQDGKINWKDSAAYIERLVRAMNSWPGAYARINEKTVKIWDCDVIENNSHNESGIIVSADKNALTVQTGDGQIQINEIQLQGRNRMKYDAFLRGCKWEAGMRFDN